MAVSALRDDRKLANFMHVSQCTGVAQAGLACYP